MVGIVLVSHSKALAEGLFEFVRIMSGQVTVIPAGGMDDGTPGTSYDKIRSAIIAADSGDGVLVIADIGSSVMTAQMVLEDLPDNIEAMLADCPMVEGAIVAGVAAESGLALEDIVRETEEAWNTRKM